MASGAGAPAAAQRGDTFMFQRAFADQSADQVAKHFGPGFAQALSEDAVEPALVTAGNDLGRIHEFLQPEADSYTAADVIRCLLEPA